MLPRTIVRACSSAMAAGRRRHGTTSLLALSAFEAPTAVPAQAGPARSTAPAAAPSRTRSTASPLFALDLGPLAPVHSPPPRAPVITEASALALWRARALAAAAVAPESAVSPTLAATVAAPLPVSAEPAPREAMSLHPNSRNPRGPNHGSRPCSHLRRKRRFRVRSGDHAGMPTKIPKGCDI